jgi:REP element-mobilizing transposase RayT
MAQPFRISRDTPALYITLVTHHRLPVFRTAEMRDLLCLAINEARDSGNLLLFAYAVMIDHLHLLTDCPSKPSDVLRVVKGLTARRVIDFLKEGSFFSSLEKLRHEERKRKHLYSLWQTEKNVFPVYGEEMFMQKVNYTHMNPVRAGLVERPTDYLWSSARIWAGCPIEDEPLIMNNDLVAWRQSRGWR